MFVGSLEQKQKQKQDRWVKKERESSTQSYFVERALIFLLKVENINFCRFVTTVMLFFVEVDKNGSWS